MNTERFLQRPNLVWVIKYVTPNVFPNFKYFAPFSSHLVAIVLEEMVSNCMLVCTVVLFLTGLYPFSWIWFFRCVKQCFFEFLTRIRNLANHMKKNRSKEHETLSFQFFINKSSISMFFVLFFMWFAKFQILILNRKAFGASFFYWVAFTVGL